MSVPNDCPGGASIYSPFGPGRKDTLKSEEWTMAAGLHEGRHRRNMKPFRVGDVVTSLPRVALRLPWASI